MAQDINQFLVTESGRLTYDIFERTQYSSPWIHLPKKVAWPQGMGEELTNIMWERAYIEAEAAWAPMSLNDGTGNSCIPPVDIVKHSQTLRSFSLSHKAVESQKFCVTDLLYTGKREAQMAAVERGLADQVRLIWIKWNREAYTRWANKYVVEPGMAHTDESDGLKFPPIASTSPLTQGVMDYFYEILTVEQGHNHALSMQNGRPVYGLITDQGTSRWLKRGDEAIREDWRQSSKADTLLDPLGVVYTYNGFVHMIDEAPPRYNFNPSLYETPSDNPNTDPWIPVPHYILDTSDPTRPVKVVNPAWLAAEFQDSFIYVEGAYQLRVPGSIAGVGGASFTPQSYMGTFEWVNVRNVDKLSDAYNPDGKIGFFRGVLASGVEGINPHVMFVLRHKVCPGPLGLVACPT